MFVEEPINNDNIKNVIIKDLCYKVTEKINTDNAYCTFLLNNEPLHDKLILTLSDAIRIHEDEEKYELCAVLLSFQEEVIKKNLNA